MQCSRKANITVQVVSISWYRLKTMQCRHFVLSPVNFISPPITDKSIRLGSLTMKDSNPKHNPKTNITVQMVSIGWIRLRTRQCRHFILSPVKFVSPPITAESIRPGSITLKDSNPKHNPKTNPNSKLKGLGKAKRHF